MISQVICCLQEAILNDDLLRLIAMFKCHIWMALKTGCRQTPCGKEDLACWQMRSYQCRRQAYSGGHKKHTCERSSQ